MTKLFAALGHDGLVHLIGEVPRGAACGCVCPECASPLIAKQGQEKDWHFAHVAGQERPECEAGAANMLRRLAIEHLQKQQPLELPPYKTVVRMQSPLRVLSQEVTLQARVTGGVRWMVDAARTMPVGRAPLEGGGTLEIFVGSDGHATHGCSPTEGVEAAVLYTFPMPEVNTLRTRVDAETHLSAHGRFAWLHRALKANVIQAAKARLSEQARADQEEYERARRRRADESRDGLATLNGARQRGGLAARSLGDDVQRAPPDHRERRAGAPTERFDWAPHRRSGTGFTLYRLRDGTAWVIYTLDDGGYALAAWPNAEDGWDEALPPSIATPDMSLGVYRIHDLVQAVMFLTARADIVRSTSNPREFDKIA